MTPQLQLIITIIIIIIIIIIKMATFQLFLSVQGTGGSPTGPDPENRVGDQNIEKKSSISISNRKYDDSRSPINK